MADYLLRSLRSGDAAIVAHHRVQMFLNMGSLSANEAPDLEAASRNQLEPLIASGEYFGWLMESDGKVVAGVGVMLHRLLPRPQDLGLRQEAYVVNVYTEPDHRRRGVAKRLMEELIAWCREHDLTRITLHAATEGRPLYEGLGFAATNEMRLVLKQGVKG